LRKSCGHHRALWLRPPPRQPTARPLPSRCQFHSLDTARAPTPPPSRGCFGQPSTVKVTRRKERAPGHKSGGRTLLSATQVSGLSARPPATTEEAEGMTQDPAGIWAELGQSHLSQKIPAATTRCVYLDHPLSRAVNFEKFTIMLGVRQGRIFTLHLALRGGA
jgi:hypothetical protein